MSSVVRRLQSVVFLLLAACAAPPTIAPPPTPAAVNVVATDMSEPLLLDLAEAYAEVNPNVAVVPWPAAGDEAAAALATGEAALALTIWPEAGRFATPLGYARMAVVVHPDNRVGGLSAAQVRAMFAGEITGWAQVGGELGPVQAVVAAEGSEGARLFAEAVLLDSAPSVSALVAPSWAAMRELVGTDPNAIGYLPAAELSGEVRVLEQLDEPRALIVAMAVSEPTGPARDFLAWAQSAAGQAVVGERYEGVD